MVTCDTALLSGISVPHWRPKDLEVAIKVDTAEWSRICVTDGDGQPEGTGIRGALTVDSAVTVYCLRCFLLDTGPPFIIHALLPRLTSVNKSTLFVCRLLRKCRKEALLRPLKKELIYRQERLILRNGCLYKKQWSQNVEQERHKKNPTRLHLGSYQLQWGYLLDDPCQPLSVNYRLQGG